MNVILQGLDQAACIQDDILLTGKYDDKYLLNLSLVVTILEEYGVCL